MRWLHSITETMDMNLENSGRCKGQGGLACCSPCDRKELDMTFAYSINLGKLPEMVRDREAWRAAVHGVTKSWI